MDYSSASFIVLYIAVIAVGVYIIWCFTLIAEQARYKGQFAILMIIPLLNLVLLGIFAFKKWPITKHYVNQQQKLIKMMNLVSVSVCDKCDATVNEQDKFCSVCGSELKMQ